MQLCSAHGMGKSLCRQRLLTKRTMKMEYRRITSIQDPLFKQMHPLMQNVFPPEEVLAFELWQEPFLSTTVSISLIPYLLGLTNTLWYHRSVVQQPYIFFYAFFCALTFYTLSMIKVLIRTSPICFGNRDLSGFHRKSCLPTQIRPKERWIKEI